MSPPGGVDLAADRRCDSQGTRVLVEYLLRDKPCVTVLDLTDRRDPDVEVVPVPTARWGRA